MRVITDFHLHSKWSRACSKDLTLRNIAEACERKGIGFIGTSDFTHPRWREEIGKELVEAGQGRAVIGRCYPLGEMGEAHRDVDMGHKTGNVVITVA